MLRLGALTTLLAILIDPFAQQLVQSRQDLEWSTSDNENLVAKAGRYSKGNEFTVLDVAVCE